MEHNISIWCRPNTIADHDKRLLLKPSSHLAGLHKRDHNTQKLAGKHFARCIPCDGLLENSTEQMHDQARGLTRRADKQHALGNAGADSREALRALQELNDLRKQQIALQAEVTRPLQEQQK